jgi:anthranilate phosphoribosyltransferase
LDELRGGDAEVNAQVARTLLSGQPGPVRDAVLLNAGAAIAAFNGVGDDLEAAIAAGMASAALAIDSGAAAELLRRWASLTTALTEGA